MNTLTAKKVGWCLVLWINLFVVTCGMIGCTNFPKRVVFEDYTLDYQTPVDQVLQEKVIAIDGRLRTACRMAADATAVGVLDLRRLRLAMVQPDQIFYGASVPKIGILLAYFAKHPQAATNLDAQIMQELGLLIKVSDNETAAKFSRKLGLEEIQAVLSGYGFYDARHGGGLWVGKNYGKEGERYGDPVADHSHAVTVRQLLRYYLLLDQGRLVSAAVSKMMREIFASPEIAPLNDRFVKGLEGREVQVLRKSGWWEDWRHDTAIVNGQRRHYIIVALTHHSRGDEYLERFAREVDDLMQN